MMSLPQDPLKVTSLFVQHSPVFDVTIRVQNGSCDQLNLYMPKDNNIVTFQSAIQNVLN